MTTILIIEDDPLNQRLLSLMLQREGYEIVTANDGLEGLDQLHANHIDLVITDYSMPNMDGRLLVQEIRKDENYKHLPIIVLTAIDHAKRHFVGLTDSANGFLTKPTSSRELIATVAKCLNG